MALATGRRPRPPGSAGTSGGSTGTSGAVGTSAVSAAARPRSLGTLRARRVVAEVLDAVADQDRVPLRLFCAVTGAALSADAGAGTGARSALSDVPTSTAMIGTPTSTVWPSSASSRATVPSHGQGSSTTALAVSISTMIWPSSTSVARLDVPGDDLGLGQALAHVGKLELLELGHLVPPPQ